MKKPKAKPTKPKAPAGLRDRVKGLEWLAPSELQENPHNWRLHGDEQKNAFKAVLDQVGVAGAMLAYRNAKGEVVLLDGHLRKEMLSSQAKVPVLILDVTEKEALTILATFDPLSQMAIKDDAAFGNLLSAIDGDLQQMFAPKTELKPIEEKPPPKMAWVLIGIPLATYAQSAELVEKLAGREGVFIESTVTD